MLTDRLSRQALRGQPKRDSDRLFPRPGRGGIALLMSASNLPPLLFDRRQLRRQRQRAAKGFPDFAVLEPQIAERLRDRLAGINRTFADCLEIGGGGFSCLPESDGRIVRCDLAADVLSGGEGHLVVGDEELLPFGPGAFDLVISSLTLHWLNDMPGALVQIKNALRALSANAVRSSSVISVRSPNSNVAASGTCSGLISCLRIPRHSSRNECLTRARRASHPGLLGNTVTASG